MLQNGGLILQVRIIIFLKGRYSKVFDSQIDNLSDIKVFDSTDEIIAEVDIEDLLSDKLPKFMNSKQKYYKISNIIKDMSKVDETIYNDSQSIRFYK